MAAFHSSSPRNCHRRPHVELFMDVGYVGPEKAEKIAVRWGKTFTHLNMTNQGIWLWTLSSRNMESYSSKSHVTWREIASGCDSVGFSRLWNVKLNIMKTILRFSIFACHWKILEYLLPSYFWWEDMGDLQPAPRQWHWELLAKDPNPTDCSCS